MSKSETKIVIRGGLDYVHLETMVDLRAVLLDELQRLRHGLTTPTRANAVANLSGKLIMSLLFDDNLSIGGREPDKLGIKTGNA